MKYAVCIWPDKKKVLAPQMSKNEQNFPTRYFGKKGTLPTVKKNMSKGSLSPRSSNVHDSRMDPFP